MGKAPLFVRPPTDAERQALEAALRSPDAFVLRRAQIVLASAQGEGVGALAPRGGFTGQAVRQVIHAFNAQGLAVLGRGSSRPHTTYVALDAPRAEALRDLLHRSPRDFDKPTSLWTLDLAAAVAYEQGLTAWRVSGETIRATLARMGVRWRRAKEWITSPDPEYVRKKLGWQTSLESGAGLANRPQRHGQKGDAYGSQTSAPRCPPAPLARPPAHALLDLRPLCLDGLPCHAHRDDAGRLVPDHPQSAAL
jgi:hypothetical protein